MMSLNIKKTIENLPEKPGVYQFYDGAGEILYIGKAKNIKKRVNGHYSKSSASFKQEVLLKKTDEIRFIIVENESDALLLENNLIKEYLPRYNILLKDDKTFPWICIKNERFPRVFITRRIEDEGSEFFGPYTSVVMIKSLFSLIKQLYTIRTCNYLLSPENIEKCKFRRCLEYHLGNCKAPCEGLQDENDYNYSIQQIRDILKGNIQQVIVHFKRRMMECSASFYFEEAQQIKQKLELLEKFRAKSLIVNPKLNDTEVFSIIDEENLSYVNYLKVVKGAIVQSHNLEVIKKLDEEKEDILLTSVYDIRKRFKSDTREIIMPFVPNIQIEGVTYVVPSKGDKKKLLDLSLRNANSYRLDRIKNAETNKKVLFEDKALENLKNELRLKQLPCHIECIDISNIQGTDPVASCVVFKSGRPARSEYRHYNIKSVTGINDFASIGEIIFRRFRHFRDENGAIPDLFIVDGGKGQLNSALAALRSLEMESSTKLIGIAKRLEEIFIPGDPIPLYLDKNAPGLKLIQRIRNEAHRFGITFHRNKRSKSMLGSELDLIKGIGDVTKGKILEMTKDLGTLKTMPLGELEKALGKRAASIIYRHYNQLL
jgi:excinuclease ABC subunit C